MRAALIANPVAARSRPASVQRVREVLRGAGWQLDVELTTGPGDARQLAQAAVDGGAELVAVLGGDGTTMQAAAALVGTDVTLGLIPAGTGNLFAGNLRIPRSPVQAARLLVQGARRRVDLGRVEREEGPVYFSVACGTGADAHIMPGTSTEAKRRWGILAYIATTLRMVSEIRSYRHRITVDGETYETEAAMVLVANCGEIIPPWVRLGREVSLMDGLFDVVTVRADGLWQSVRAVAEVLRDLPPERRGSPGDSFLGYARGRVVTVETDGPQPVEMDGEPHGMTPFTAEVVPGAVTVVAPWGQTGTGGTAA